MNRSLSLHTPHGTLHGQLALSTQPRGLVLLARAHHLAVDNLITANLANRGYAILAMELLTSHELQFADATQNVPRLTQRLLDILELIRHDPELQDLPLAIYATGDATPAAIRTAAQRDAQVRVLACHGGLIDRAGLQGIKLLSAPLLMLCDKADSASQLAWQRANGYFSCSREMYTLEMAEDPVPHIAAWFSLHLGC